MGGVSSSGSAASGPLPEGHPFDLAPKHVGGFARAALPRLVSLNEEEVVLSLSGFGRVEFHRFVPFGVVAPPSST